MQGAGALRVLGIARLTQKFWQRVITLAMFRFEKLIERIRQFHQMRIGIVHDAIFNVRHGSPHSARPGNQATPESRAAEVLLRACSGSGCQALNAALSPGYGQRTRPIRLVPDSVTHTSRMSGPPKARLVVMGSANSMNSVLPAASMMLMPPASSVHTQTLPSACTFRLSAIDRSRSFA